MNQTEEGQRKQSQNLRKAARASKRAAAIEAGALPKEIFWHVLSYWRSSRDAVTYY